MKTLANRFLILGLVALHWLAPHDVQASAPAGRYTYPDGSQSSSQTVYDTKTGLTWQRNVSMTTVTWSAAQTACANAGLPGTGWRLPSVKELASIVDYSVANPAIDPVAFPRTPALWFWTADCTKAQGVCDQHQGPNQQYWYIKFDTGGLNPAPGTVTYYVRCVH